MKKMIICSLFLIASATSFSQPVTNPAPTVKTDYLQKSKNQKTAAWICFGGGSALFITGLALTSWDFMARVTPEESRRSGTLLLTGATSMLISIPFFIA